MTQYAITPKLVVAQLSIESLNTFELGQELLILVSKTIYKMFSLSNIFDQLKEGRHLHIYSHIRPDTPFEDLDVILDELNGKQIDNILAIGGGSIIDAAKALSVAFQGVSYKDLFYKKADMPSEKIKVLAIPTTAGTGAELSFGAIIYDKSNGVKGGLRGAIIQPDEVLLDARLHNACPFKLKAEVGFDCLTHAVETYISKKSNPLVRSQSVACIQTVFNHLLPACESSDLDAMENIAISSSLMGINLAYSSTCLPHRIQYVIGPMTGTSHAEGLIALYKGWLHHLADVNLKELNQLVNDLNMDVDQFLETVEQLKQTLSIDYTLADLGVKEDRINHIAESVTGNVSADPSYKDTDTIKKILINSF